VSWSGSLSTNSGAGILWPAAIPCDAEAGKSMSGDSELIGMWQAQDIGGRPLRDDVASTSCGKPSGPCFRHHDAATAAAPVSTTARRWPASLQAQAVGDCGGLHPAGDAQLGQDVGDVHAGGRGADEQRLGDLASRP
jgi:hypothetical protein